MTAPASPPPTATIRRDPEDFVVEELPAYEPAGEGEHLFVTLKKRDLTTLEAVRRIAAALGIDAGAVGFAGMKDRHAVTTQTLSLPPGTDPSAAETLSLEGISILAVTRHPHKLKTGHLRGNRFVLRLRDLSPTGMDAVAEALTSVGRRGVPNAFGPQRFGRHGDLGETALAWVRGERRGPRDKRKQRLWFSAFQSLLFNRILEAREADGTAFDVEVGDLAKKSDTGGMFLVAEADLADARARAAEGLLSPTGPMFGAKMRWPEGRPAEVERAVLASALDDPERLGAFKRLGKGSRRPLRLVLEEVASKPASDYLEVRFVLPKGGYATTVLERICRPVEADCR